MFIKNVIFCIICKSGQYEHYLSYLNANGKEVSSPFIAFWGNESRNSEQFFVFCFTFNSSKLEFLNKRPEEKSTRQLLYTLFFRDDSSRMSSYTCWNTQRKCSGHEQAHLCWWSMRLASLIAFLSPAKSAEQVFVIPEEWKGWSADASEISIWCVKL